MATKTRRTGEPPENTLFKRIADIERRLANTTGPCPAPNGTMPYDTSRVIGVVDRPSAATILSTLEDLATEVTASRSLSQDIEVRLFGPTPAAGPDTVDGGSPTVEFALSIILARARETRARLASIAERLG